MNYLLLILMVIISSCKSGSSSTTSSPPTVVSPTINSDFSSYIQSFETLYATSVNFSVMYDEEAATGGSTSSGTTIGVCRIYTSGKREILVSRTWWNTASTINKKILIHHELGHCLFNREHDFEKNASNERICVDPFGTAGTCTVYKYRKQETVEVNRPPVNAPISLMYPTLNEISANYSANQSYYDYELNHEKPQTWNTSSLTAWNTAYNDYRSLAFTDNSFYEKDPLIIGAYYSDFISEYDDQQVPTQDNGNCVKHIDDRINEE